VRLIAERRRDLYVVLPITEVIAERARDVQIRMAARRHHQAAGAINSITAAVAEHHGAVVLHYDAGFEHIAAVTGQPQTWVAPRDAEQGQEVGQPTGEPVDAHDEQHVEPARPAGPVRARAPSTSPARPVFR